MAEGRERGLGAALSSLDIGLEWGCILGVCKTFAYHYKKTAQFDIGLLVVPACWPYAKMWKTIMQKRETALRRQNRFLQWATTLQRQVVHSAALLALSCSTPVTYLIYQYTHTIPASDFYLPRTYIHKRQAAGGGSELRPLCDLCVFLPI